ncbi:MAG: hypothetical protein KKE37_06765, partial [Verrucomicrobia bacterium]|nr:hypothetical protein [Verrucomicrobiota bacterium]MBU4291421.1 hypothetical protein [Verrucomicrobiota bacterium]MBU4429039.1 hypothetical protein [Verrucomicrobiota bacterium]MCG2680310.1 hypothetical protein [Kiritimatiellia bacterium]
GYKGLTTCVERITHWVIRPTRRLFANALSALTKSEYCAIFAQYSGIKKEEMLRQKTKHFAIRVCLQEVISFFSGERSGSAVARNATYA